VTNQPGSTTVQEEAISRGLAERARQAVGGNQAVEPYLRHYLAEHVWQSGNWDDLAEVELVDALDVGAVTAAGWRSRHSTDLPAAVKTTMLASAELATHDMEARRLTRALAAARLGLDRTELPCGELAWASASRESLHLALKGHTGWVRSVAFGLGPDGRLVLASGSDDGTVRLWDPGAGRLVGEPLVGHTAWVNSVAFGFGPDGRLVLASGSYDDTVRLWEVEQGHQLGEPFQGPTDWVTSVACGRLVDGRVAVASGSADGTVRLWDVEKGQQLGELFQGYLGWVNSVAFGCLADGRQVVASGSADGFVHLWDVATGRMVWVPFEGHTGGVGAVAFGGLADGRTVLASGGCDGTVRLWDIPLPGRPRILASYDLRPSEPLSICFANSLVVVGCSDGLVALDPQPALARFAKEHS